MRHSAPAAPLRRKPAPPGAGRVLPGAAQTLSGAAQTLSAATRALRRAARALLGAACALGVLGVVGMLTPAAHAQDLPPGATAVETRPEPVPDPDAKPKPPPRAKRVQIKETGTFIYKCGDEFTDQPVCQNNTRAARIQLSPEDQKRCDDFKRGNFIPWYCRK